MHLIKVSVNVFIIKSSKAFSTQRSICDDKLCRHDDLAQEPIDIMKPINGSPTLACPIYRLTDGIGKLDLAWS